MNHFYQNIPGYFTWPSFYSRLPSKIDPKPGTMAVGVEIGTANGQSLAYLGVEFENRRLAGGPEYMLIGVDPDNANGNAKRNLEPLKGRVELLGEKSVDAARHFADGSLDFVFIDGDHSYESVRDDIAAWFPKLVPGGLIAGHDFSPDFPGVVWAVIEAFGKFFVDRGEKYGPVEGTLTPSSREYFPVWWAYKD